MIINLYHNSARHQTRHLKLFESGLKAHGVPANILHSDHPRKCDLAVLWGVHSQNIIDYQKKSGGDYLVMERGYFGDRFKMTSIGYGGLNGRADFLNEDRLEDRWLKHGVVYSDWKKDGDYILLMGQVMGDASLKGADFLRWIRTMFYELNFIYDKPIVCRPHPQDKAGRQSPCREFPRISKQSLGEDLKRAFCVVTFNSNSGVDAVLAGVPVIAWDRGSMVWPIATHNLKDPLFRGDRLQWAKNIAYCQWTESEIKKGLAWDHLKQKYEVSK